MTGIVCCAPAASGHAAALPMSVMKSRRRMGAPLGPSHAIVPTTLGGLKGGKLSALGHKRTFAVQRACPLCADSGHDRLPARHSGNPAFLRAFSNLARSPVRLNGAQSLMLRRAVGGNESVLHDIKCVRLRLEGPRKRERYPLVAGFRVARRRGRACEPRSLRHPFPARL